MIRSNASKIYPGLDHDANGGMTAIGKMIRDAWLFGLLPETETCEGWGLSRIDVIYHQVNEEWDKYGSMVSSLPDELQSRHKRIYDEAVVKAKARGWDPGFIFGDAD